MSSDAKPRSVLSELRRPLLQAHSGISAELESRLLGTGAAPALEVKPPVVEAVPQPQATPAPMPVRIEAFVPAKKSKAPTVPVTFHLPIELRDKIKLTAQAKQTTMLEIAVEALNSYLERNQVSEADVRRLLGL